MMNHFQLVLVASAILTEYDFLNMGNFDVYMFFVSISLISICESSGLEHKHLSIIFEP